MNDKSLSISFDKHDSLPKVFAYYMTWVLVVVGQLATIVSYISWVFMMTGFMGLWFAIGLFLFATKVMAIRRVHNWWYHVWTGTDKHDKEVEIDVSLLNEALFAEFIFESLPQMVVQSMNNTLTQLWNPIGIFSMCLSVAVMLNGLYRYGYYSFWLGYSIQNVPTEISFGGIKVSVEGGNDKEKMNEKDNAKDPASQGAVVDIESSKPSAEAVLVQLKYTDYLRKEVFAMRDAIARYLSLTEFDEIGRLFDVVVADIQNIEVLFSKYVYVTCQKASSSGSSKKLHEARSSLLLKLTSASDAVMPSPVSRASLFGGSSSANVAALNAFASPNKVIKSLKSSKLHSRKSRNESENGSESDSSSGYESAVLRAQGWAHDNDKSSSDNSSSDNDDADVVRLPESTHSNAIQLVKQSNENLSVSQGMLPATQASQGKERAKQCQLLDGEKKQQLVVLTGAAAQELRGQPTLGAEETKLGQHDEEQERHRQQAAAAEAKRVHEEHERQLAAAAAEAKRAHDEELKRRAHPVADPLGLFAPITQNNAVRSSKKSPAATRLGQVAPDESSTQQSAAKSNVAPLLSPRIEAVVPIDDPLGLFTGVDISSTAPSSKKQEKKSNKRK